MKTAEVNKEKRVRHCYPRQEVYHRFVHSGDFVYHRQNLPVYAIHDYLFVGDCSYQSNIDKTSKEDFPIKYDYLSNVLIAVIDRKKKRILITRKFDVHWMNLTRAVPSDYEIFYTTDAIPSLNILNNKEELYKTVAKFLVERYTEIWLSCYYKVLLTDSKICKIDYPRHNQDLDNIKDFISKYKIKKYKWYKESLNPKFKLSLQRDWWKKTEVAVPSLKALNDENLFTEEQIDKIRKCYFYDRFCYTEGISYKFIDEHFNKKCTKEEAKKYFKKIGLVCQDGYFDDVADDFTWNEIIEKIVGINRNIVSTIYRENVNTSQENYLKAKAILDNLVRADYSVNDWRERKSIRSYKEVTYQKFKTNRSCKIGGNWVTEKLYANSHCSFSNTQLRLNGSLIETSRYATVTVDEGKKLWHMLIKLINSDDAKVNPDFNFDYKDIKAGIYNLRRVVYTNKITDDNKDLGEKEWCIIIGCHHLWLDDIIDFIKYYKLEDDFPINNLNHERN